MSDARNVPTPEGPAGLLLSRDLIFTSKVTGTAAALGHRVIVAGNVALASAMLAKWSPSVVFVDLAAGDLVSPDSIAKYREIAGPGTPFVAFGSHVDAQALADAAEGGLRPGDAPEPVHQRASRPDPPLFRRGVTRGDARDGPGDDRSFGPALETRDRPPTVASSAAGTSR